MLAHDIDVGGAKSIKQHAYRVNPEKRALMQKEVEYMVENGIAEPSNSPWSSPCILVPKANTTSPRFCSDLRKLNSVNTPGGGQLCRPKWISSLCQQIRFSERI